MDDKEVYFKALNEELAKNNMTLDIICVGGFVLEYHGLRGTKDVDAFYQDSFALEQIIEKVGEKYHINTSDELWLNNSVANMNDIPPISDCEKLYSYSHLTVYAPSLEYILGMKAKSGRAQDIEDMGEIIKHLRLTSPFEVQKLISANGLGYDFSDILEAFSLAYGMEWLEQFYIENQEELGRYL